MIDPAAIARRAFADRDHRTPLATIEAVLGPCPPTPHPRDVEDERPEALAALESINAHAAVRAAWFDLAREEGLLFRGAPDDVLRMDCEWCGRSFRYAARYASNRRFCGYGCARKAQIDVKREERMDRNREIVAAIEGGEDIPDVAERVGLTERYVARLVKDWRDGTGWAEDDEREAAA